jgi:hypothetical protein
LLGSGLPTGSVASHQRIQNLLGLLRLGHGYPCGLLVVARLEEGNVERQPVADGTTERGERV